MASTIEVPYLTGQTLTVELYPQGSDTIANGAGGDTMTEATNSKGRYTASVAESLSGWHYFVVKSGAVVLRNGYVKLVDGGTNYVGESSSSEVSAVQTFTAALLNQIADHVRRRTQANVEASSDGDALSLGSLYGFIQQAQETSVAGTTMTIKQTDGTTTLGTKVITVDAGALPMTGIS